LIKEPKIAAMLLKKMTSMKQAAGRTRPVDKSKLLLNGKPDDCSAAGSEKTR